MPKTKTDRPSIIKKEHAQRQIKGELRLPFVLSGIQVLRRPLCRSELAREELKGTALIQTARVIVDVLREQARSCSRPSSALLTTQLLDTYLAHPEFLDLAGYGHWKLFHELEVTRCLEVRDALLAPGLQLLFGSAVAGVELCLLYTSPSPRDRQKSRMPSSA